MLHNIILILLKIAHHWVGRIYIYIYKYMGVPRGTWNPYLYQHTRIRNLRLAVWVSGIDIIPGRSTASCSAYLTPSDTVFVRTPSALQLVLITNSMLPNRGSIERHSREVSFTNDSMVLVWHFDTARSLQINKLQRIPPHGNSQRNSSRCKPSRSRLAWDFIHQETNT